MLKFKKKGWPKSKGLSVFKGGKRRFVKFDTSVIPPKKLNWFSRKFDNRVKNEPFSYRVRAKISIDRRFNLCLWVRQTYNNIFLTVTDSRGGVRFVISGGFSKLRGNNRASHRSIEVITRILLKKLQRVRIRRSEFRTLCVFLVTPKNSIIKSFLRLLAFVPQVRFIAARLRIPHNGIRMKKLRRL